MTTLSAHSRTIPLLAFLTASIAGTALTTASAAPPATVAASPAPAASAAPRKVTKKAKAVAKEQPRPVQLVLPEPSAEQIAAAERVYYGVYECEFKQTITIQVDPKFPSYVDLQHGKMLYIMKPVVSTTGAIRLEDVMADTLMVQIASKSMLLNVNTGQRLVDDCISAKQREAIEAARDAKIQEAAAAASGASAPTTHAGNLF